jgi:starvation-inducible DNA-binding protein
MNPTRNDLPAKTRSTMVALLNARLADLSDLQSQVKQAHWNVKGPSFIALHELFDEVAEDLGNHIDDVAERAVQLGGIALGTVRAAAEGSTLPEFPLKATAQEDHLKAVADRLAQVCKSIRKAIDAAADSDDAGTADLFTDVSRALDKHLWFVESHLEG